MDMRDIFVKLVKGAKFTKRRSSNNSQIPSINEVKIEPKTIVKSEVKENIETNDTVVCKEEESCDRTIALLGNITATENENKKKRKRKGKILSEDLQEKLKQEEINHYRNTNLISVVGRNVPPPLICFNELESGYNVDALLIKNLKNCGYENPTAIQKQAMTAMLQKRQVLCCAPTGSGKTAAFMLPILSDLGRHEKNGFRAVILCPTRELAKQILRECIRLSEGTGLRPHFINKVQQEAKRYSIKTFMKFDLLITTPKRLCFLLNQDPVLISLEHVEWLIVDEADKLFESGIRSFRDQLDKILLACSNKSRKIALFSATQTPTVAKWARHNMKGLINVTVGQRNSAADSVDQELLFVGDESGKLLAIRDLIRKGIKPPVLVFVQSKERAQELFTELIYDGINVDVIHADRTQTQRDNTVRAFREGRIWVLICTELMGRGVDFLGVNLVLNYDFPTSAISYIHRIGRTGRAGQKGKAITFYSQNDVVNLRSIARVLHASGCKVPEYMLTLKKTSKKNKKLLKTSAPKREGILTIPTYEKNKINRKRQRLEKAKLEMVGVSSSDEENLLKPIRPMKKTKLSNISAAKNFQQHKRFKQKKNQQKRQSLVGKSNQGKNKYQNNTNNNGCD